MEAAKAFEEARNRYERAVGESILTADGQHFDMHKCRSYWRVQRWYGNAPREVEVWIYPHGLHIDSDNGKPSVRWHDARGWIIFPIAELYAEKANAQKACLAMLRDDLAALTEIVRTAMGVAL